MGNETVHKELQPVFEAVDRWDEKKLIEAFSRQQSLTYFFAVWISEYHSKSKHKGDTESYLRRLANLTELFPPYAQSLRRDIILLSAAGLQEIGLPAPSGPLVRMIVSRRSSPLQRRIALRRLSANLRRRS